MKLFVGLGNPGGQYALNRHNVGFMAVDAIAATHDFPAWRKRFSGLSAEGKLGNESVLLFKPQTFMNEFWPRGRRGGALLQARLLATSSSFMTSSISRRARCG